MHTLIQHLWDQMSADLRSDGMPQMRDACRKLLDGTLGPLTDFQKEDLESVDRSLDKLNRRLEGEPIAWDDYSEAAHALRGPLNAIIGFSRLILKGVDGPINEAQQSDLEVIYNASRQMLTLFNLLLDALLISSQDMSFKSETVQVGQVLEELITAGKVLAKSRNFAFAANVSPSVNLLTVQSDDKRLKQILSALLAVSAQYIDVEDGELSLRVHADDDQLLIQFESSRGLLPASLLADPSRLLTDDVDLPLPYDVRLRFGLAWHLLNEMGGALQTDQTDDAFALAVSLPIA